MCCYPFFQKQVRDFEIDNQEKEVDPLNFASKRNIESERNKIRKLENEKEGLIQANLRLSKEVSRLMSVDNQLTVANRKIDYYREQLQKRDIELTKIKSSLVKKELELRTTEIMVSK